MEDAYCGGAGVRQAQAPAPVHGRRAPSLGRASAASASASDVDIDADAQPDAGDALSTGSDFSAIEEDLYLRHLFNPLSPSETTAATAAAAAAAGEAKQRRAAEAARAAAERLRRRLAEARADAAAARKERSEAAQAAAAARREAADLRARVRALDARDALADFTPADVAPAGDDALQRRQRAEAEAPAKNVWQLYNPVQTASVLALCKRHASAFTKMSGDEHPHGKVPPLDTAPQSRAGEGDGRDERAPSASSPRHVDAEDGLESGTEAEKAEAAGRGRDVAPQANAHAKPMTAALATAKRNPDAAHSLQAPLSLRSQPAKHMNLPDMKYSLPPAPPALTDAHLQSLLRRANEDSGRGRKHPLQELQSCISSLKAEMLALHDQIEATMRQPLSSSDVV